MSKRTRFWQALGFTRREAMAIFRGLQRMPKAPKGPKGPAPWDVAEAGKREAP